MGSAQSSLTAPSLNTELTVSYILSAAPHTSSSNELKHCVLLHPSAQIRKLIPHLKLNNPILQKTIQISLPEEELEQVLFSAEGSIFTKTLPSEQLLTSRSSRMQLSARGVNTFNTSGADVLNEITSSQNSKQNSIFKPLQTPLMAEKYKESIVIPMTESSFTKPIVPSAKSSSHNRYNSALFNKNNTQISGLLPFSSQVLYQSQIQEHSLKSQANTLRYNTKVEQQQHPQPSLIENLNTRYQSGSQVSSNNLFDKQYSQLAASTISARLASLSPQSIRQSISLQEKLKTLDAIPSYSYVTMNPTPVVASVLAQKEQDSNSQNFLSQKATLSSTQSCANPPITNEAQISSIYQSASNAQEGAISSLPKKEAFTLHKTEPIQPKLTATPLKQTNQNSSILNNSSICTPRSNNNTEPLNKFHDLRNKSGVRKLNDSALPSPSPSGANSFTKARSQSNFLGNTSSNQIQGTTTTPNAALLQMSSSQNINGVEAAAVAAENNLSKILSKYPANQKSLNRNMSCFIGPSSVSSSTQQPAPSARYYLPLSNYGKETVTQEDQSKSPKSIIQSVLFQNDKSAHLSNILPSYINGSSLGINSLNANHHNHHHNNNAQSHNLSHSAFPSQLLGSAIQHDSSLGSQISNPGYFPDNHSNRQFQQSLQLPKKQLTRTESAAGFIERSQRLSMKNTNSKDDKNASDISEIIARTVKREVEKLNEVTAQSFNNELNKSMQQMNQFIKEEDIRQQRLATHNSQALHSALQTISNSILNESDARIKRSASVYAVPLSDRQSRQYQPFQSVQQKEENEDIYNNQQYSLSQQNKNLYQFNKSQRNSSSSSQQSSYSQSQYSQSSQQMISCQLPAASSSTPQKLIDTAKKQQKMDEIERLKKLEGNSVSISYIPNEELEIIRETSKGPVMYSQQQQLSNRSSHNASVGYNNSKNISNSRCSHSSRSGQTNEQANSFEIQTNLAFSGGRPSEIYQSKSFARNQAQLVQFPSQAAHRSVSSMSQILINPVNNSHTNSAYNIMRSQQQQQQLSQRADFYNQQGDCACCNDSHQDQQCRGACQQQEQQYLLCQEQQSCLNKQIPNTQFPQGKISGRDYNLEQRVFNEEQQQQAQQYPLNQEDYDVDEEDDDNNNQDEEEDYEEEEQGGYQETYEIQDSNNNYNPQGYLVQNGFNCCTHQQSQQQQQLKQQQYNLFMQQQQQQQQYQLNNQGCQHNQNAFNENEVEDYMEEEQEEEQVVQQQQQQLQYQRQQGIQPEEEYYDDLNTPDISDQGDDDYNDDADLDDIEDSNEGLSQRSEEEMKQLEQQHEDDNYIHAGNECYYNYAEQNNLNNGYPMVVDELYTQEQQPAFQYAQGIMNNRQYDQGQINNEEEMMQMYGQEEEEEQDQPAQKRRILANLSSVKKKKSGLYNQKIQLEADRHFILQSENHGNGGRLGAAGGCAPSSSIFQQASMEPQQLVFGNDQEDLQQKVYLNQFTQSPINAPEEEHSQQQMFYRRQQQQQQQNEHCGYIGQREGELIQFEGNNQGDIHDVADQTQQLLEELQGLEEQDYLEQANEEAYQRAQLQKDGGHLKGSKSLFETQNSLGNGNPKNLHRMAGSLSSSSQEQKQSAMTVPVGALLQMMKRTNSLQQGQCDLKDKGTVLPSAGQSSSFKREGGYEQQLRQQPSIRVPSETSDNDGNVLLSSGRGVNQEERGYEDTQTRQAATATQNATQQRKRQLNRSAGCGNNQQSTKQNKDALLRGSLKEFAEELAEITGRSEKGLLDLSQRIQNSNNSFILERERSNALLKNQHCKSQPDIMILEELNTKNLNNNNHNNSSNNIQLCSEGLLASSRSLFSARKDACLESEQTRLAEYIISHRDNNEDDMDCCEEGERDDKQLKGLDKIDQRLNKNRNNQDIEQKEIAWNYKQQEEVDQVCLNSSRSNQTDKADKCIVEMKLQASNGNSNSSRNSRNSVSQENGNLSCSQSSSYKQGQVIGEEKLNSQESGSAQTQIKVDGQCSRSRSSSNGVLDKQQSQLKESNTSCLQDSCSKNASNEVHNNVGTSPLREEKKKQSVSHFDNFQIASFAQPDHFVSIPQVHPESDTVTIECNQEKGKSNSGEQNNGSNAETSTSAQKDDNLKPKTEQGEGQECNNSSENPDSKLENNQRRHHFQEESTNRKEFSQKRSLSNYVAKKKRHFDLTIDSANEVHSASKTQETKETPSFKDFSTSTKANARMFKAARRERVSFIDYQKTMKRKLSK